MMRNESSEAERAPVAISSPPAASPTPRTGWPRWLIGYLLLFAALVVWRREVLWSPPYEDQAVGLWSEADFLADSGFSYRRLRWEEEHFMEGHGGRRSYMVSVQPTLVALGMVTMPSIEVSILVWHLAGLAAGAFAVLAVFALLRPRIGGPLAALVAAAVLTTPLFAVQIDLAGMDIPMTALALLAALLVMRGRYTLAAIASTLSFFMKATGSVVTMATICYLVMLWILSRGPQFAGERRKLRRGLVVNIAALVFQITLFRWGDTGLVARTGFSVNNAWSLGLARYWCPELAAVFLATLGGGLVLLAWWLVGRGRDDELSAKRGLARWGAAFEREKVTIFAAIVVAGMLAALVRTLFIPRYITLAVPFLYMAAGGIWLARPRMRLVAAPLLVALIGLNVLNHEGRFLAPVEAVVQRVGFEYLYPRSCGLRERSRECLVDHHFDVSAMRLLEAEHADDLIVARQPYSLYLVRPRLGYVSRPLRVHELTSDMAAAVGEMREILAAARQGDPPRAPVFVRIENRETTVPPPAEDDEIIFDDQMPSSLVVFRPNLKSLPPADAAAINAWYLGRLLPEFNAKPAVQASLLASLGRVDEALDAVRRGLERRPDDASLRRIAAQLEAARGDLDAAAASYEAVLEKSPGDVEVLLQLGVLRARQDRLDEAARLLQAAVKKVPQHAQAHNVLGLVLARQGKRQEAIRAFNEALRLAPDFEEARRNLQQVRGS